MTKLKNTFWRDLFKIFCIILIIPLSFSLSSCFHMKRKDGPPKYHVNENKIPNAVPKDEPLSKFGNMASYQVFGKRYYPMKSAKGFEQVGTASWYGSQFHRKRTSSGERYNMLAMTAAHKTLPLPTYIEVTNLSNDKKVIVKVNDRGPFESSRILDLSYVAAKKLGVLAKGTARVRIRAIDPSSYNQDENLYSYTKGKPMDVPPTYVQAGIFTDKSRAVKFAARLKKVMPQPIKISEPSMRNKYYRVNVGPLADDTLITYLTEQLKKLGLKPQTIHGA